MKKILFVILIAISSFATVNYAKPKYCLDAFEKCLSWCEEHYDWYEYPLRVGCKTGCAIGYIAC